MFLIRTAFWAALVIMLLPTDTQSQHQVFGVARAAFTDVASFCDRNPDVCIQSKAAFDKFSEKAEFGAKLIMDMVRQSPSKNAPPEHGSQSTNTLRKEDLEPIWDLPNPNLGA